MLKKEFSGYSPKKFSKDLMAGLTVTAVALPLALAFGVSCGASAEAGLVTAILAGLIISALSGASYQISGPTGAMSAVLMGIIASRGGLQSVFIVSFLAGVIILLCAVFRLGRLVAMIPGPVITGFTSGIALTIALGQIDNFFGTSSEGANAVEKLISYGRLGFHINPYALLLGAIVIVIMVVWPKKWNARVPSSLVGIIVATAVCAIFGFDEHVSVVGLIPKKLMLDDKLTFSSFRISELAGYISPAISIAALALIESLLCGASASKMKDEEFNANQELVAQGIGNMIIPFFGGVPATAAIARTSVAIKSGCQTRLCGIIHALGLLASMFLLSPVMAKIPLSALAGVLLVTAWRMNEWESIRYIFGKRFYGAIAKFLLTMIATIVFDLTVAILIGIGFSALLFVYRASKISVYVSDIDEDKQNYTGSGSIGKDDTKIVYITGPVFFANVGKLEKFFADGVGGASELIISLRGVSSVDTSGVKFLCETCRGLEKAGTKVLFCGANETVAAMTQRGGIKDIVGENAFYPTADKAIHAALTDSYEAAER